MLERPKTKHLGVTIRFSTQWGTSHHIASPKRPQKVKSEKIFSVVEGSEYNGTLPISIGGTFPWLKKGGQR